MPTVSPSRVPVKLKYLILDENGKTYKATNLSEVNRMKRVLKNQGVKFKVTKLPRGSTTWNTNPKGRKKEAPYGWRVEVGSQSAYPVKNESPQNSFNTLTWTQAKKKAAKINNSHKNPKANPTTVPAHVRINPRNGRIQVFVTPKVAEKLRGVKGLRVAGATNKRNPVKQYEVKIPPGRLGSYRLGYVAPNVADAKRRALADYNRSLSNEGFPTVKSLPRGTKVIVH
jgi:hypothetical protein